MSSNKYWEIWMERKKHLITSDKNKSIDNNETNNNNKSFNSFVSDRQNYINFLENKIELAKRDRTPPPKNNDYDDLCSRMNEIERRLNSVTKLVEFQSSVDTRKKVDPKMVENMITSRIESLNLVTRKILDNKLSELEFKMKEHKRDFKDNNISKAICITDLDEFKLNMKQDFIKLQDKIKSQFSQELDLLDKRIHAIKNDDLLSTTDKLKINLEKIHSNRGNNGLENKLYKLESKINSMDSRIGINGNSIFNDKMSCKIEFIESQLISTTEIAVNSEKIINELKIDLESKYEENKIASNKVKYTKENKDKLNDIDNRLTTLESRHKIDTQKVKDLMTETTKLLKSTTLNTNEIEKELKERLDKKLKDSYEKYIAVKIKSLKSDLDSIGEKYDLTIKNMQSKLNNYKSQVGKIEQNKNSNVNIKNDKPSLKSSKSVENLKIVKHRLYTASPNARANNNKYLKRPKRSLSEKSYEKLDKSGDNVILKKNKESINEKYNERVKMLERMYQEFSTKL